MSRSFRCIAVVFSALAFATAAFSSSLQDWEFNVNGTSYLASNGATTAQVPDLNLSGFNITTGQGTVQFVFNPGSAGTYYIAAWFFNAVSTPFYNEYGAQNGSPAAGQTWQIDIPDYDSDAVHTGTIVANTAAGTLDNTNHIPGTTNDYTGSCSAGASCNDATSMAMGFKFTLTSSQEEVINLLLSPTNPGGFYLEQVHPVDGANNSATDLFFSGVATTQPNSGPPPPPPPPPNSPEPTTWALLTIGLGMVILVKRRMSSN